MEENKFWFRIWAVVALTLVAMVTLGTVASQLERLELTAMVAKGADPLRAACALGIGERNATICATLAVQVQKAP